MSAWKDQTSYSRNEPEPRVPRTFERNVGRLRLVVTRHIHLAPDAWLLRVDGILERDTKPGVSAERAQKLCEEIAATMLREALAALEAAS